MENRNHKDSLFIDLFCKDQKSGKENFISLYNAPQRLLKLFIAL